MKQYFIISIVAAAILLSCSKGGNSTTEPGGGGVTGPVDYDTTAPGISINNPTSGQTLASGVSTNIQATITDDYGLYQGYVRVTNDANGFEMFKRSYEIHGLKSYNLSLPYTPTVTAAADYTITIFFEDHGNNSVTKSVKVKVLP